MASEQKSGETALRVYSQTDDIACQICKERLKGNMSQAAFLFNVDLDLLLKSTRKKRRKHLGTFFTMVNVLMNQGGGVIYIHSAQDLLGFWDDQVDEDLMNMVPDDTLFQQNFERHMLNDKHVAFRVKPRDSAGIVSTRDFKSKVSLNKGLVDPNHGQMRHLIRNFQSTYDKSMDDDSDRLSFDPKTFNRGKKVSFHESLSMQAKVVDARKLEKATGRDTASKLLNYWWKELKLPKYIAAFSKQPNGGSFFLGLREEKIEKGTRWKLMESMTGLGPVFGTERQFWEDDKNEGDRQVFHLAKMEHVPTYETKTGLFVCEGVRLSKSDHTNLEEKMKQQLKTHMLWYPGLRSDFSPVSLDFHEVTENSDNNNDADSGNYNAGNRRGSSAWGSGRRQYNEVTGLYVVEARVQSYNGICFQDQYGPEAYTFDYPDNPAQAQVVAMPMENWIRAQS